MFQIVLGLSFEKKNRWASHQKNCVKQTKKKTTKMQFQLTDFNRKLRFHPLNILKFELPSSFYFWSLLFTILYIGKGFNSVIACWILTRRSRVRINMLPLDFHFLGASTAHFPVMGSVFCSQRILFGGR